jgi:predicted nucleic acid-binding protein
VLDSWAMLAWLQDEEPARAEVRDLLERSSRGQATVRMSLINVGKVFYLIAKRHGSSTAEPFLTEIPMMPLQTLVPDRQLILSAAWLKSRFAISYADAFAVETARQEKTALLTGNPELFDLSKREPVEILWVGAAKHSH